MSVSFILFRRNLQLLRPLLWASLLLTVAVPSFGWLNDEGVTDGVITLERHSCERHYVCPVYKLIIFSDGDIIFDGIYNVARKGLVHDHVNPSAFVKLVEFANAIHYFSLDPEYGFHSTSNCASILPDRPLISSSITFAGKSHGIIHHHRCAGPVPKQLTTLEDAIDKAANVARWTK